MSLAPVLRGFLLLSLTVAAVACSQKDATKCQDALAGTRKSLAVSDYGLTGQWRNRAYTYCADTASLTALDHEIVNQQATETAAKEAELQRKAQNEALLKTFSAWVGDNRAAPDHAAAVPTCDGEDPTKPAESKERLCTATRNAGTYTLTARYWEADHAAELFTTTPPGPISCDDLGPNKPLKQWDVPATNGQSVKRTRCELSSGALSGMNAVVSAAANAPVYLFSPAYLEKDAAFKKIAGE